MKVTVIKKNESVIYNGVIYSKGQSFEADDLIGKSLIERGYVEAVGDTETHTTHLDAEQLKGLSYHELKKLASNMGLDSSGKKVDLIARLCAVEVYADFDPAGLYSDLPNTNMPD